MFIRTGKHMSRKDSREFARRTEAALKDKRLSEKFGLKTGRSAPRRGKVITPETTG